MTWNLYFGFDERPLFLATPDQIPTEVSKAWAAVKKTDFRVRARAIVKHIRSSEPDLIGLQEAAHYDLLEGDFSTLPPTVTGVAESIDFVDILLDELHDAGLSYRVASVNLDTDVTLPDAEGTAVRLLDRDVILVRHDRPRGQPSLHVSNPQAGTYAYLLPLCFVPDPVTGDCLLGIDVKRGWASVDVRVAGEEFRFVTTHLEDATPLDPPELQGLQFLQAAELASLIGASDRPVILTGDFNSDGSATPPWPASGRPTTRASS
jgi:Endonuclease/Exonuclease/phosphatase family